MLEAYQHKRSNLKRSDLVAAVLSVFIYIDNTEKVRWTWRELVGQAGVEEVQ